MLIPNSPFSLVTEKHNSTFYLYKSGSLSFAIEVESDSTYAFCDWLISLSMFSRFIHVVEHVTEFPTLGRLHNIPLCVY